MRVIFMGTPDFAVRSLQALIEGGHEVILTVTQPDRPKGRGGRVTMSPVKETALGYGIPVFQPTKIRKPESIARLETYEADVIVVVAFGQILPKAVLDLPKYCCVNVHGSLLPKYRGASPIQWTILSGDTVGGVTTMRMDEGLDTGDMIMRRQIPLAPDETSGSLFEKVSTVGAQLLLETLNAIEAGTAVYTRQDSAQATKTGMITKQMGVIDFSRSAEEIIWLIRGMDPWPSAQTRLRGRLLKIWKADALTAQETAQRYGLSAAQVRGAAPGTVLAVTKKDLIVASRESALNVRELQAEGKKRMATDAFLRGYPIREGEILGV